MPQFDWQALVDWQQFAALSVVGATLAYLGRRAWSRFARREVQGCGSCGSCASAARPGLTDANQLPGLHRAPGPDGVVVGVQTLIDSARRGR